VRATGGTGTIRFEKSMETTNEKWPLGARRASASFRDAYCTELYIEFSARTVIIVPFLLSKKQQR